MENIIDLCLKELENVEPNVAFIKGLLTAAKEMSNPVSVPVQPSVHIGYSPSSESEKVAEMIRKGELS